MFVNKNFDLRGVLAFSGHHIIWLTAWAGSVTALYEFFLYEYVSVPWLPLYNHRYCGCLLRRFQKQSVIRQTLGSPNNLGRNSEFQQGVGKYGQVIYDHSFHK